MNKRFRQMGGAIFATVLLAGCACAQVRYRQLPETMIEEHLKAAPDKQSARGDWLRKELLAAGCAPENLRDDVVKHVKQPNIVCVLPGRTARQIVVGAHYDYVDRGHGIVDNWSGASLLPSLLASLDDEPREHTFVFIAFTAEEEGLLGSKSYVEHLSKEQRQAISAMVNIDTLGLTPTKVWASGSSEPLVNALYNVSQMMKLPLKITNISGGADADSSSFRAAKIPEICIHSVTQETWKVLHSPRDQIDVVNKEDYYQSYRLIAGYLATLDSAMDAAPKDAAPATGKQP